MAKTLPILDGFANSEKFPTKCLLADLPIAQQKYLTFVQANYIFYYIAVNFNIVFSKEDAILIKYV